MNVEARAAQRTLWGSWTHALKTCSCGPAQYADPVTKALVVTRACVQPMTLVSVLIAGLLAVRVPGFDPLLYVLAAIGSIVAHGANNMINDYFDLDAGLDRAEYPRSQYAPHPVLSGLVSRAGLGKAILVANALDAAIMIVLFLERGWPIVAFALAGLFISVFYVAPPLRLKARGLGEPSVFLIWGPVMVCGTYFAAVGKLPAAIVWASLPYALLVAAVLMGKHIDKASWDLKEGVKTLPVVLGERRARAVTTALLLGFYLSIVVLVATRVLPVWVLLVALAVPHLRGTMRVFSRDKPAEPPRGFRIWPLWFGPWAFLHSRRAGAYLVAGLFLGAVVPGAWPL